MWQLPILVLAGIIISSTSLIIDSTDTIQKLRGQDHDNTFYNNNRDLRINNNCNNLAALIDADAATLCKIMKLNEYLKTDNNNIVKRILKDVVIKKDLNYNGKGFRTEQWHNYPRQLDRLQSFLYKRHKPDYGEKEYVIENDPQIDADASKTFEMIFGLKDNDLNMYKTNEICRLTDDEDSYRFDSVITANSPLMILKLQLAYALANNEKDTLYDTNNIENTDSFKNIFTNMDRENPTNILLNLNSLNSHQNTENYIDKPNKDEQYTMFKSLPSKKRIFSIWSRVQSMNPKGHELHHRRFMHSYYAGLPSSDGSGGIVSAETRALTRPPGSPLRWG